ncbi:cytochrome c [Roseibium sp. SCP14]|uniref:cytochrome c n=1 Tax=Roseibium sp. SCP14 TaxID=3141375 RepID=UPI00333C1968
MKRALILWSFLVSFLIFVAILTGYLANQSDDGAGLVNNATLVLQPDNPVLVRQGAEIYENYCSTCHGSDRRGEPDWQAPNPDGSLRAPPHDETGHTWHHADELLFNITKFGTAQVLEIEDLNSPMQGFAETLSDEEIVAVLSWIKSTWPENIKEQHDTLNRRVQEAQ